MTAVCPKASAPDPIATPVSRAKVDNAAPTVAVTAPDAIVEPKVRFATPVPVAIAPNARIGLRRLKTTGCSSANLA